MRAKRNLRLENLEERKLFTTFPGLDSGLVEPMYASVAGGDGYADGHVPIYEHAALGDKGDHLQLELQLATSGVERTEDDPGTQSQAVFDGHRVFHPLDVRATDEVMAELGFFIEPSGEFTRVTNGNGGGVHLYDEQLGRSSFLEVLDISGNQLTLAEGNEIGRNSITEQSLPHMDQVGLHSMEEGESNRI